MQEKPFNDYQPNDYQKQNITAHYVEPEQPNQVPVAPNPHRTPIMAAPDSKYCKFCGSVIARDSVVCVYCGRQVEELKVNQPQTQGITINNSATANPIINTSIPSTTNQGFYRETNTVLVNNARAKNKWLSFLLCFFFGFLGAHKFYEGKIIFGILYFLTFGIFGLGILADLILILLKPNPYYV